MGNALYNYSRRIRFSHFDQNHNLPGPCGFSWWREQCWALHHVSHFGWFGSGDFSKTGFPTTEAWEKALSALVSKRREACAGKISNTIENRRKENSEIDRERLCWQSQVKSRPVNEMKSLEREESWTLIKWYDLWQSYWTGLCCKNPNGSLNRESFKLL